jgi:DnaK suppressor protein
VPNYAGQLPTTSTWRNGHHYGDEEILRHPGRDCSKSACKGEGARKEKGSRQKLRPKQKQSPRQKQSPKQPKPTAKAKAAPKAKAKASPKARANSKVARAVGEVQNFDDFKPYKPSRGESYMNDEQLEHFRQLLLSWRSDLVNEVTKTVGHMKDEAANFPDPADRATQEEEFSLELRARDRERKLIKKIDGTLERISIDDYGYCDACGIEIGVKRLEARPTATLCIDCKTLAEIKERQELG